MFLLSNVFALFQQSLLPSLCVRQQRCRGNGDREEERIFLHQERVRIGLRIRELRKEKNIEAKTLAKIANIDAANLSRIEQGRYAVGLDVLSRIALVLGAKVELADFGEPKKS